MRRVLLLPLCALLLLVAAQHAARGEETALDRYIAKPDPAFSWKLAGTVKGDGYTTYILDLTSQTWRSETDVDRPLWKHWLPIVVPDGAKPGTAFLFIGGGSNRDAMPKDGTERTIELAKDTGTAVAELHTVPNQPLFFTDSKDEARSEDNLIAYTRVKYIATHDPNWLVRLAMVKSGVRAMDAIQQCLAERAEPKLKVEKFVVAGGSKRGWTTWLVGVVDPRVVAIVPMVIDALNSEVITRHHYEAYGFFSPALNDYVRHGLFPHKVGTPEYREILQIEDPYNYRDRPRLKMPKFMINAAGDQFFLPDNSQFYYNELPEEKYIRYVPNAKHDLKGSDARESLSAFYQSVLDGSPRPKFSWRKASDGSLRVTVKDKPAHVNLWQATNLEARDFRLDIIGKAYSSTTLEPQSDGTYLAQVGKPAKGFTAFFVELVYPTGKKYPFKFTTEVSVVPDLLPFKMPSAGN
jgi:PhoPQ-activated pathogenicity-related protein